MGSGANSDGRMFGVAGPGQEPLGKLGSTRAAAVDRIGAPSQWNSHMSRQIIHTDLAPAAIGPYSQAVRVGNTVYFSGQIPLDPATGNLVEGDISLEARRAFDNLKAVAEAAGGSLAQIARLGLYLTDLGQFAAVNAVMQEYFDAPFPARSTVEVSALPKGAAFEVDAVMVID